MFKRLGVRAAGRKSAILSIAGFAAGSYFLFIRHLGDLTPGLSPAEKTTQAASADWHLILANPIYGPHKIIQLILVKFFGASPTTLRLASVIMALTIIIIFYQLTSRWFGKLISAAVTGMLATTPFLLINGRSATPIICFLLPAALICVYYLQSHESRHYRYGWLFFCSLAAITLYIPGMAWLFLAAVIIKFSSIKSIASRQKVLNIVLGLLFFLGLLFPLGWGLAHHTNLIKSWLLIPADWPNAVSVGANIVWSVADIFVRAREHVDWIVGRLPLLSALESILTFFGIWAMYNYSRGKLYWLAGLGIFGLLAASLNDEITLLGLVLVPLALISGAGLRFLYMEWHRIFPRNPIPKYFAYGLIVLLSIAQISFGVTYGLSAWPNAPSTKALYVLK